MNGPPTNTWWVSSKAGFKERWLKPEPPRPARPLWPRLQFFIQKITSELFNKIYHLRSCWKLSMFSKYSFLKRLQKFEIISHFFWCYWVKTAVLSKSVGEILWPSHNILTLPESNKTEKAFSFWMTKWHFFLLLCQLPDDCLTTKGLILE